MIDHTAHVLKALGEPTRLKIVRLLAERELCVCELVAILDASQPRISQHLKILRQAGIIIERKDRQRSFFSLQGDFAEGNIVCFDDLVSTGLEKIPDFNGEARRFTELDRNEEVMECKQSCLETSVRKN